MAPPSPNTTRGHLWEIAPVPILQLLTSLVTVKLCLLAMEREMSNDLLSDPTSVIDKFALLGNLYIDISVGLNEICNWTVYSQCIAM